jgi:membrane-bound lytic murein transglycosylase MltF
MKNNLFEDNDSIFVTYFCGLMNTTAAIRCEKLSAIQEQHPKNKYSYSFPSDVPDELMDAYLSDSSLSNIVLIPVPVELIDTFIVDSNTISRIEELLNKKVIVSDFSEDARMYVTVKKSDGNTDYLCFDSFPNQVKYNGQACSLDKELLFLLRYYSGYYSWFDVCDLDRFKELQDTMLYQKVLKQIQANEFNNGFK